MFQVLVTTIPHVLRDLILQSMQTCSAQLLFLHKIILVCIFGGPFIYYIYYNGPKSLILAPQDIPDISGYQLGFGCQCVKAYNNENPVTNQKIL